MYGKNDDPETGGKACGRRRIRHHCLYGGRKVPDTAGSCEDRERTGRDIGGYVSDEGSSGWTQRSCAFGWYGVRRGSIPGQYNGGGDAGRAVGSRIPGRDSGADDEYGAGDRTGRSEILYIGCLSVRSVPGKL